MNHCLWCDEPFFQTLTWRNLFGFADQLFICEECRQSLLIISGEICRSCGRMLETLPKDYVSGNRCNDCIRWEMDDHWRNVLVKNRSVYVYNSFLKEIMARFKFRGDAILIQAIQSDLKKVWDAEFSGGVAVPIPLSRKRLYERGFNQAVLLANMVSTNVVDCLIRPEHEEKQSKKSRSERINRTDLIFEVERNANLVGKEIVLIDDIYTTGATVRHAAKALLNAGATSVSSLTVARS